MTEEREFINKIRGLKQIKPNQDWVVFTKNQILGQEDTVSIFSILQTVFQKPVFVVAATLMLLIAGIAGFFYLTEKPTEIAEAPTEPEIILALGDLQKEIEQATEGLRKIEEPQKILDARNVVVPTIEAVREVITETEKLEKDTKINKDKQVLGIVINVNESINELENTLDEMTAILAESLIQDLETRTLTQVQQEILEKAKQAHAQGNYTEALVNSLFINQLDK